ncbi:hypothetical protein VNO77_22420 [Canavalia gladiata]|uniref:Uncharacterized protein n=1 Tax=Canavalia gladiata TaxID=3824 RepID=A0AAN9L2R3_CANGL
MSPICCGNRVFEIPGLTPPEPKDFQAKKLSSLRLVLNNAFDLKSASTYFHILQPTGAKRNIEVSSSSNGRHILTFLRCPVQNLTMNTFHLTEVHYI